ncbi:LOW QUALITY PROTEIN: hypothetical protein RJ641_033832 [Dillenia turbinata]|uniref:Uncharacterized protein n=1 Tax=Dillenia turbinata TaxID=194707 RepID=A0AAN8VVZ9_9MAGN
MAMWVTSFPRLRRKMFEVFFYTHHLYGLYIFYILHVGATHLCMILPASSSSLSIDSCNHRNWLGWSQLVFYLVNQLNRISLTAQDYLKPYKNHISECAKHIQASVTPFYCDFKL